MSVVRSSFFWVLPAVLSIGCESEIDHAPALGSDEPAQSSRDAEDATPSRTTTSGATTSANACESGASWSARNDFVFEGNGDFAATLNGLIRESDVAPIAVSSHMDPGCVWRVAFSATETANESGFEHPTTFAPMLRHPAGLWTGAPQSSGWLRVVDRVSRAVWLPLENVTGSATYGESTCASLSSVRVTATMPESAGDLTLATAMGTRTVRELMGASPHGFVVRFAFSAEMSR